MISFRLIRNIGLGILFLLILSIGAIYFLSQDKMISKLKYIVTVENVRMLKWVKIDGLNDQIKSRFHNVMMARSEDISPLISIIDDLGKELDTLSVSGEASDKIYIEEIRDASRKFKSALFGYAREVREGYYGTNAIAMDKAALDAAGQISEAVEVATRGIINSVKKNNDAILGEILMLNKILIPMFFMGMVLVLLTAIMMSYALMGSVRIFSRAMANMAQGNFDYRVSESFGGEIGRLGRAFNKMAQDMQVSEGNTYKARQMLGRITDGVEEEIMLLDADFKIQWANKKAADSLGRKEEGFLGRRCNEVMHELGRLKSPDDSLCPLNNAKQSRQCFTAVHTEQDSDSGRALYKECTVYPLFSDEGNLNEYIHIVRDVTRRIELEDDLKNNIAVLEKAQIDLQKKMRELEKFHKVAVDRELRIAELKKKVAELETKGG